MEYLALAHLLAHLPRATPPRSATALLYAWDLPSKEEMMEEYQVGD
jgi:hypothetical protein